MIPTHQPTRTEAELSQTLSEALPKALPKALQRKLIFVHGKGGVGKTVVSQAIASLLGKKDAKTLWVTVEDPTLPAGELREEGPHLWHLNCDFTQSFEEYAAMKIGGGPLTRLFLQNKLIRYLAKAAPGIHELVLLGKIWFERNHYDHVVVDLPSTGYGLAMFQSTENFSRLFRNGPLYRDAEEMLGTFRDPKITTHLVVGLPEEMPLRESIELSDYLKTLFPENEPAFIVNRLYPDPNEGDSAVRPEATELPHSWASPLATSSEDYVEKRFQLENHNLRLWRDAGISFGKLDYVTPASIHTPREESFQKIVDGLADQLQKKGYI